MAGGFNLDGHPALRERVEWRTSAHWYGYVSSVGDPSIIPVGVWSDVLTEDEARAFLLPGGTAEERASVAEHRLEVCTNPQMRHFGTLIAWIPSAGCLIVGDDGRFYEASVSYLRKAE